MRRVDLDELARGTVAADGTCEVTIGPIKRQIWYVANVGVQCIAPASVTDPLSPSAKLYLGPSRSGQFLGGTYDGAQDNIPAGGQRLGQGARITVVWEDADPGAACIVTVVGQMDVPG